jgi:hypothetical protein
MGIPETDWKTFKRLRLVALDRFSQRVVDECQAICTDKALTAHERYLKLYERVQKRNEEMAPAFDDFRRSTALLCLRLMVSDGLLTEQETSEFSSEVQRAVSAQ